MEGSTGSPSKNRAVRSSGLRLHSLRERLRRCSHPYRIRVRGFAHTYINEFAQANSQGWLYAIPVPQAERVRLRTHVNKRVFVRSTKTRRGWATPNPRIPAAYVRAFAHTYINEFAQANSQGWRLRHPRAAGRTGAASHPRKQKNKLFFI